MTFDDQFEFGEQLETVTDRYLDQLDDCVRTLPPLIETYRAGDEYRAEIERIQRFESDCDTTKLELGTLITGTDNADAGLRLAWVHLHADRLLELYRYLDEIANVAEQFAEELGAIEPRRNNECLDGLLNMSELAVAAASELERVVREFVRALCRPEYSVSITDGVSTVRALEGDADSVRNEVIEAAFDGEHNADAVVYRQLAVFLDTILDSMEDVTDQMHLMTGSEEWLDFEIYPPYDY